MSQLGVAASENDGVLFSPSRSISLVCMGPTFTGYQNASPASQSELDTRPLASRSHDSSREHGLYLREVVTRPHEAARQRETTTKHRLDAASPDDSRPTTLAIVVLLPPKMPLPVRI
ncbi:unnamed protein product [Protopolystoma xenopodis]|uniref:Uncharacterized protein n=1 Tax=Protopolystoma xenopodis TaxID=117903 RepID=A0A3S5FFW4_9PLAT|nr:unnamed protein product [Protopolystoma xenopodis]